MVDYSKQWLTIRTRWIGGRVGTDSMTVPSTAEFVGPDGPTRGYEYVGSQRYLAISGPGTFTINGKSYAGLFNMFGPDIFRLAEDGSFRLFLKRVPSPDGEAKLPLIEAEVIDFGD